MSTKASPSPAPNLQSYCMVLYACAEAWNCMLGRSWRERNTVDFCSGNTLLQVVVWNFKLRDAGWVRFNSFLQINMIVYMICEIWYLMNAIWYMMITHTPYILVLHLLYITNFIKNNCPGVAFRIVKPRIPTRLPTGGPGRNYLGCQLLPLKSSTQKCWPFVGDMWSFIVPWRVCLFTIFSFFFF